MDSAVFGTTDVEIFERWNSILASLCQSEEEQRRSFDQPDLFEQILHEVREIIRTSSTVEEVLGKCSSEHLIYLHYADSDLLLYLVQQEKCPGAQSLVKVLVDDIAREKVCSGEVVQPLPQGFVLVMEKIAEVTLLKEYRVTGYVRKTCRY